MADLVDLSGLSQAALSALVEELGERPFRSRQIYRWVHQRGATSFEQLSDLSKELRSRLSQVASLGPLTEDLRQASADGTVKHRFLTRDGHFIESVYLPSPDRQTLCVSTQAGCAMGCSFCMTATLGLRRNLTPGEMVAQVHAVNSELRRARTLQAAARPLTNLVFMGMGEPLHNFENLKAALEILQSQDGPNFSHRHITVSTAGLVPMIERFGAETQVKLAISLNASSDEQRSRLMPLNRKWNLQALLEACRRFPLRQGRRITFEYVLIAGENDSDDDARRLVALLAGIPAKVNLIQYNDNPGLGLKGSDPERVARFRQLLDAGQIAAFVRQNRGRDIAAACGQLANRESGTHGQSAAPP